MKRFPWPLFGLTALVIVVAQYGFATASTWRWLVTDDFYTTYHYDQLADAFRVGQLHLRFDPPAALIGMPDPYEPAIWQSLGALYEATLFQGRYYLYYGPVPALFLAPVKLIAPGVSIPDSVPVLFFTWQIAIAITGIIGSIWWRWYREVPVAVALAGTTAAGLGLPILFILGRPAFYEVAIAGSQAFFMSGIAFLLLAVPIGSRSGTFLALAGSCWALALGCRLTTAGPIMVMLIAVFIWIWRSAPGSLRSSIALLAPIIAGVGLIGLYNALRFGSPLETGLRYILTGSNFRRDFDTVFSLSYILPNAYHLLARPFTLLPVFPYISWTPLFRELMPGWLTPPARMYIEPVVGILPSQPFLWFLPLGALSFGRRGESKVAGEPDVPSLLAALTLAVVVSGLATMSFHVATMRYLLEIGPLLTVVALVGALELARRTAWLRRIVVGLALLSAGVSILISALFGVEGYFGHLRTHNPGLFAALGTKRFVDGDSVPKNARATFGDVVELIGYQLGPRPLRQGDDLVLVLWWRALRPAGSNVEIHVKLLNRDLDLFYERRLSPVSNTYPFELWPSGEAVEDHHRFTIPIDSDLPDELFFEISVETRDRRQMLPIRDPAGQIAGTIFKTAPITLIAYHSPY